MTDTYQVERLATKYHRLPSEILRLPYYDLVLNTQFSNYADEIMRKRIGADKPINGVGRMIEVIMRRILG